MIWLVLFALSYVCGQEEVPKIIVDADNFKGFPVHFFFLKVTTNTVQGATYHWLKEGQKITKDSQPLFSTPYSRMLVAESQSKKNAGIYQFVMTTKAGIIKGREITVDFTYLGEFNTSLPKSQNLDVVVGQANFIKCPKHEPGSHVIYKWGKTSEISGTKFLESKPNYIVLDDGTLFYSHLTEDNARQFNDNEWTCGMEAKVNDNNQFRWAEDIKIQFQTLKKNMTEFGPKIVTTLPQNKTFQEENTISMKCAATGRPTPVYSWKRIDVYKTEYAIEDGKDGFTFEDGDARLLVVNSVRRDHAGQYFCTATIGDKNDTVEGSLKFEVKPKWIGKSIESVKPSIDSSHSWTCNATGFPMPTYKWYKNGVAFDSSAKHEISGGTLTFLSLEETDTGMYECVADNNLDNIYQTAHLDVQAEKPVFDTNTGKTTLFLGAKGVIKCHAKAAPAATNTWRKDGVVIDFSLPRYTLVKNEDLVIDSVSKQDFGNYTCKAENRYGDDVKKISVQVVGEITFISEPQDVVTTRGMQIKLKCKAEGDKDSPIKATIKYKWKYNNKDIELNDTIVWSDAAHSLVFLKTQVSQSGVYECIAYIDQPSYAEKRSQANVVIRGPPEAPNKVKIDGDCSAFSAKLMWHITGSNYEPIKYFIIEMATSFDTIWRHNKSEHVDPKRDEKTINNLSPWTKYRFRVLAINEIGTSAPSEPTIFDNCETPQRTPTDCPKIQAIPGKENELTLKWEKIELIDQDGEDFNYVLQYSSPNPKFSQTKIFKPYELEFKIPNAGYYRPWTFKIQGKNKVGGGPSCEGNSYSGQNAPSMAPKLTVTKFGAKFVDLQWKAISLDRGSVDGYKLTYNQVSKSSKTRRSISAQNCDEKNPCREDLIGSDTTSKRLEGLIPYTQYRIAIRGFNSGGLGPEDSIVVSTEQALPGAPDVRTKSYAKFIKVEWEEPRRPNGLIAEYKVVIDKDANPREVVLKDSSARKYVFGGLVPNKGYVVYVQAKTKAGFGEKKYASVDTTSLKLPAKPNVPLLTGVGEDGVNVTFKEGESDKGFPERFIVVYRVKDGKDDWKETKPVLLFGPKSKPYVEIYKLDKNKEYEMATIAVNEKGRSDMSDIATVQPGNTEGATPKAQNSPIYKRSWFVAIVVVVCFLLIILLVALLVTRKRGERYPVGKREKKRAGILDVGEEPDYNTYPMKPPRQNGNGVNRQDSGGSLPNRDPDRDSLDEYGEDRFDEDAASLIGAYNDDRRHNKTVDEPEFV